MSADMAAIAPPLLAWYDRHARKLPWRVGPKERARGVVPDPYRVWLSEIMLQQTGVTTVKPYFADFVRRWPTVETLAAANRDDVLKAWAGLGYYARARNLKACAEAVASRHDGEFPATIDGLKALPGIGEYTAAAIAAIAPKLGCTSETLRRWVRQAERDTGYRAGVTTDERQRLKELEREVRELKRANEILRKASAYFAQAELDRRAK